jgi:tetratricopeptide (TPR) repeat protein
MRVLRRLLTPLLGLLVVSTALAWPAQAQEDDPAPVAGEGDTEEPEVTREPSNDSATPFVAPKLRKDKADGGTRSAGSKGADAGVELAAPLPKVKTLKLTATSDADLDLAWERWRKATADGNAVAAAAARTDLFKFREDLALASVESFAAGFVRAADARQKANDASGAVDLASAAVELAPSLPYAHLGLASAYYFADGLDVGRYLGELGSALSCMVNDPRYVRPALADLGASLLVTFFATTCVVAVMLFARRARYFLHDFHHLLPKAAARWQSVAAAALLLSVPVVMRLGAVPLIFMLLVTVALYLSFTERAVVAVLITLLGLLPYGASFVAKRAVFAGTQADDVLEVERGGHGAEAAVARVAQRAAEDRAVYAELFVLGRYELQRGKLEPALTHLKAAIVSRAGDARAMVNLGNAMAAKGDLEGATVVYESAAKADPQLAAAFYNLGRVLEVRAAALPAATAPLELDRARSALAQARQLDPKLEARKDPGNDLQVNRLLVAPGLPSGELASMADVGSLYEKVQAQVGAQLFSDLELPLAALVPLLMGLALLGLGELRLKVGASKVCNKCGRPVCRRCDPELGRGSEMCHQCVNVFARKDVVPPPVKVRKQVEVARHQSRMDKVAIGFGLVCSGAGHLFAGLTIRGTVYAFWFLFVVVMVFLRNGVVRTPYGDPTFVLRMAALVVIFLVVYLLPLRGLTKRQAE